MANQLETLFTDIADAIRNKKGTTEKINALNFPSEIEALEVDDGDETLIYVIERNRSKLSLPNTITKIGNHAFAYFDMLTSIEIPSSVTSIGRFAFNYCSRLTSVKMPSTIKDIQYGAFSNCQQLTSIEIPASVTSMEEDVFYNCKMLTSVIFQEECKITNLRQDAFCLCSALTSIEIPASVTSIGKAALKIGSATNKATITFKSTTPPSIGSVVSGQTPFYADYLQEIRVPASAVETYKTATNWSTYANYIVGYEE